MRSGHCWTGNGGRSRCEGRREGLTAVGVILNLSLEMNFINSQMLKDIRIHSGLSHSKSGCCAASRELQVSRFGLRARRSRQRRCSEESVIPFNGCVMFRGGHGAVDAGDAG